MTVPAVVRVLACLAGLLVAPAAAAQTGERLAPGSPFAACVDQPTRDCVARAFTVEAAVLAGQGDGDAERQVVLYAAEVLIAAGRSDLALGLARTPVERERILARLRALFPVTRETVLLGGVLAAPAVWGRSLPDLARLARSLATRSAALVFAAAEDPRPPLVEAMGPAGRQSFDLLFGGADTGSELTPQERDVLAAPESQSPMAWYHALGIAARQPEPARAVLEAFRGLPDPVGGAAASPFLLAVLARTGGADIALAALARIDPGAQAALMADMLDSAVLYGRWPGALAILDAMPPGLPRLRAAAGVMEAMGSW